MNPKTTALIGTILTISALAFTALACQPEVPTPTWQPVSTIAPTNTPIPTEAPPEPTAPPTNTPIPPTIAPPTPTPQPEVIIKPTAPNVAPPTETPTPVPSTSESGGGHGVAPESSVELSVSEVEEFPVRMIYITGFKSLNPSTSIFGITFRPVDGVDDYVVSIYDRENSVMALRDGFWSENRCVPYDDGDYCVDMGGGLTRMSRIPPPEGGVRPFWFVLRAEGFDGRFESRRVCFDGVNAWNGGLCPDSEKSRWDDIDAPWFVARSIE